MATRARRRVERITEQFPGSALQRLLVLLVTVKVAGVVLVIDPFAEQAFTLAKAQWSRVFEWAICGALLLAVLRYGASVVPRTRLHLAVAALAAVTLASTFTAADRYLAMYGDWDRYLGLTFLVDMVVLYLAVAVAFKDAQDWRLLGLGMSAATLLTVAYAALQAVGFDPIPWNADVRARPTAFAGNAGPLGTLLVASVAACLAVYAHPPAGSQVSRVRAGAAVIGASALAAVVLAAARSSALGLLGGLLVVAAAAVVDQRSRITRGVVIAGACASVLALVAVLALTPLGARLVSTFGGSELADRALLYRALASASIERPLLGWGPDNVAVAYVAHRPVEAEQVAHASLHNNAHSWPIQALVTTGVPGLALLALLAAAAVAVLWRVRGHASGAGMPLLAVLAAYTLSSLTTVGSPAADWIPWLAFGGAAALGGTAVAPKHPGPFRGRRLRTAAVLVVLVVAAAAMQSRSTLFANEQQLTARLATPGSLDLAVAAGRSATVTDPGRALGWDAYGKALYAASRYRDAGDAFAEAATRAPHDATNWLNLARARLQQAVVGGDLTRGGTAAALEAARRAVQVDPNAADSQAGLADVEARVGDPHAALDLILRAYALYSGDPAYETIAVLAAGRATDLDLVRRRIGEMVAIRDGARLRVALAQAWVPTGDQATVRLHALRALELDPGNQQARTLAGIVAPAAPLAAPRVAGVDRNCSPLAGSGLVRGQLLPRCVRVLFRLDAPLVTGSNERSATDPRNYLIDDQALPAGSTVDHDAAGAVSTIQLPASTEPPAPGIFVAVRNVADTGGRVIDANAFTAPLP